MSEQQTFLKDKSYGFVPLLKKCERTRGSNHQVMEKDTYNGKLKLSITVLSPLHIGGKQQGYDSNGNIVKNQMQRDGKFVIPGSSLKGAVRAIAEAVSYSCAVKVPDEQLKKILPKHNQESCSDIQNLCPTCSIFGMIKRNRSYKGKVSFGEFILKTGQITKKTLPLLESPFKNYPKKHDVFNNGNYGNERLYYCQACDMANCQECRKENYFEQIEVAGKERKMEFRGRKFYNANGTVDTENQKKVCYEMLEPKSVLTGEIIFQNLREEEGKLLAYALDIDHYFTMKLGYGKPLGYGNVRIDLEEVENMGSDYLIGKQVRKEDVEKWGREYRECCPVEIGNAMEVLEQIMNKV